MKLRDASASTSHKDYTRYLARVEIPLTSAGVHRLQKCVQEYAKDNARVLVAPTRFMGVLHRRGPVSTVLCDVDLSAKSVSVQQEMRVSKLQVQPQDVIVFSLLPGGTSLIRSFYRGQVKDWADDLIVEEVEWCSWIALVTAIG